jgi:hypothetical protein
MDGLSSLKMPFRSIGDIGQVHQQHTHDLTNPRSR